MYKFIPVVVNSDFSFQESLLFDPHSKVIEIQVKNHLVNHHGE